MLSNIFKLSPGYSCVDLEDFESLSLEDFCEISPLNYLLCKVYDLYHKEDKWKAFLSIFASRERGIEASSREVIESSLKIDIMVVVLFDPIFCL